LVKIQEFLSCCVGKHTEHPSNGETERDGNLPAFAFVNQEEIGILVLRQTNRCCLASIQEL
jgi:hypothetical protein